MEKEGEIFWGISFWAVFLGILFLMNAGVLTWETIKYPDQASAATTSVAVTASVAQSITCTTPSGSTAFGTLSSASITTAATNATTTMSCGNVGGGCTLYVKDANGGLATTSPAYTIRSPNAAFSASTTLVAGTEGFGIHATTTNATGTGAVLTIAGRYLVAGDATGNVVGGATTTNQTIANTTATTSGHFITVTHKAAISDVTQAGAYTDTITYECTAT